MEKLNTFSSECKTLLKSLCGTNFNIRQQTFTKLWSFPCMSAISLAFYQKYKTLIKSPEAVNLRNIKKKNATTCHHLPPSAAACPHLPPFASCWTDVNLKCIQTDDLSNKETTRRATQHNRKWFVIYPSRNTKCFILSLRKQSLISELG